MFESLNKKTVIEALSEDRISNVIEELKARIHRDSYDETAHRLLGDLYLTELQHDSYALVQYRKLAKVQDEIPVEDRIRLAIAYERSEFHEQLRDVISDIDRENVPEIVNVLDQEFNARELVDEWLKKVSELEDDLTEDWYRKHVRNGVDYLESGHPYRAQKEFEKALEFKRDPDVLYRLARSLFERRKFPQAINTLKNCLEADSSHKKARQLLDRVYTRLGIKTESEQEKSGFDRDQQERAG